MNPIKLRGHHIGSIVEYFDRPNSFMKTIISGYGIETAKRKNNLLKKITDETEILLVNGLDDICRRCVYNTCCASEDWQSVKLGLINHSLRYGDKYSDEIMIILDGMTELTTDCGDHEVIHNLGLDTGKIYSWKYLKEQYLDWRKKDRARRCELNAQTEK